METGTRGRLRLWPTIQLPIQLEISLLLFYVGAVGACTISVVQPDYLEVDFTHKAVTIQCNFSFTGCPSEPSRVLWFRYGAQQPETLCWTGCKSETEKFTTYDIPDQKQAFLTVHTLTSNDSAIYICGIAMPNAKHTGGGTTLVVRGSRLLSKELQHLLTALLALLSFYIIGMGIVFLILSQSKSKVQRRKDAKEDSQKKRARRIFQEIAQEFDHKRNLETSHQSEKDGMYENRRALANYKRP
ncbi:immunoglobulin superfamily member 6 [Perognathus longimembris pacificus]|uniref:immunoglobulin superfamily member 6 n=1 Tax=Perognathus longimembris pacificus TaxID=214514 RepID=UPI002018C97E|nr:immunoglobulin superfamily member 6 [Perognathus longimembris pacificus]